MKPYDPKNFGKPQIRLPTDDGPNPYDSKTPIKSLGPRWLWDWGWWVAIIIGGVGWYLARQINGG